MSQEAILRHFTVRSAPFLHPGAVKAQTQATDGLPEFSLLRVPWSRVNRRMQRYSLEDKCVYLPRLHKVPSTYKPSPWEAKTVRSQIQGWSYLRKQNIIFLESYFYFVFFRSRTSSDKNINSYKPRVLIMTNDPLTFFFQLLHSYNTSCLQFTLPALLPVPIPTYSIP